MNKITAVGQWEIRGNYAERRYEVYRRVRRGWILVEKGWIRKGQLPTQRFRWVYNPWASEPRVETPNESTFIFQDIEAYFDAVLVDPEDLLPEWAEAYILL